MAPKRKKPCTKNDKSGSCSNATKKRRSKAVVAVAKDEPVEIVDLENEPTVRFLDEPIDDAEARITWPERYKEVDKKKPSRKRKKKDDEDDEEEEEIIRARRHFTRAIVDECHIYEVNDDAHVETGEGKDPYICRIVEMLELMGICISQLDGFIELVTV